MNTTLFTNSCGIDFGTTNSAVCLVAGSKTQMVPLEDGHITTPSAIYFDLNTGEQVFGRTAIGKYHRREGGRLMRSLKSLLGTSTIEDTCHLILATGENRFYKYTEILGFFIKHLKDHAEKMSGQPLENVVVGRPVHFVDYNATADAQAQTQLEAVFKTQGFKTVRFQYEPIAAALSYEQHLKTEQIALIVDMGGGTSDFSLVRLSPERHTKADRSADILANHGVHIAGNDFDQALSLAHVMPLLGYGAAEKMPLPNHYFFRLAHWPEIQSLYNRRTLLDLQKLGQFLQDRKPLQRLQQVIEFEEGHLLASYIEEAKIALSDTSQHRLCLEMIEENLSVDISRKAFESAITDKIATIQETILQTVQQAARKPEDINHIFITGGSAQLPMVQAMLKNLFPNATLHQGDMFSSVSQGLGLMAKRDYK